MIYKIPSGVTGFVCKIDERQFKAFCYTLQTLGLIEVIQASCVSYPNNFYKAEVKDREGKFYIYINYSTLTLGFNPRGISNKLEYSFVDKPLIEEAIEKLYPQYSVVPASILNSESTKDNFTLLDEFEYQQVLYWYPYPYTIGGVFFTTLFD